MNFFERQMDFNRTLIEINQNAMQELVKTGQSNMQKYMEMNSDFGQRLPETRDISSLVELQREYGESLWGNIREASQSQAEIVRAAVEETNEAVRKVFTA